MIFLNQIETTIRKATSSSYDSVRCAITLLDGYGAVVAHIADVYSRVIDGYHVFLGVEELVRAYMLQNNLAIMTPSVKHYYYLNGESASAPTTQDLGIVYSGTQFRKISSLTADVFLSTYFLTHYRTGFICAGMDYRLYYYATQSETYTIVRTSKTGTTNTVSGSVSAGIGFIEVSGYAGSAQAVVTMGSRTFTLYYIEADVYESFRFRNAFNRYEEVAFPASVTESPKTEYETAQQDNVLQRYDIEEQLEFKIQTPPLPAFTYQTLLDLCRSSSIIRFDTYMSGDTTVHSNSNVIIKEYKFDKTNEPNKPLVLELTLQYSDTKRNSAIDFR